MVKYAFVFAGGGRCMENVYALRYAQTLARLSHAEVTAASDTVMTDSDHDDDGIESMKID